MSRYVIGANQTIFGTLDAFCAAKGLRISNANRARWIKSESRHRSFLRTAQIETAIHFGFRRKLARLRFAGHTFFVTVGFEQENSIPGAMELDVDAAFLTVALAELRPRPTASTDEIRNIVETTDKETDPAYNGHDTELVASLFPKISVFQTEGIPITATWNVFFKLCVQECELSGVSWIEGSLAATLRTVSELEEEHIPYRVLCRSIFDGDPSSFFLALYRCLEALYAFDGAKKLVNTLDISKDWAEVAVALEEKLGWRPRDEGSLASLLSKAAPSDLYLILQSLGHELINENDLARQAAKNIYRLRNSIVHYRPLQYEIDFDKFDWTKICEALACAIIHVYGAVF